jgi:hypothetical protein
MTSNASALKIHSATSNLVRFKNKKYFLLLCKTHYVAYCSAGGLAPEHAIGKLGRFFKLKGNKLEKIKILKFYLRVSL